MCRQGWVRRGEEEEAASQAEAGTYSKAEWWRVALLVWLGLEEERNTDQVNIFLLRALGSCWRVPDVLHIMKGSLAAG